MCHVESDVNESARTRFSVGFQLHLWSAGARSEQSSAAELESSSSTKTVTDRWLRRRLSPGFVDALVRSQSSSWLPAFKCGTHTLRVLARHSCSLRFHSPCSSPTISPTLHCNARGARCCYSLFRSHLASTHFRVAERNGLVSLNAFCQVGCDCSILFWPWFGET